MSDRTDDSPSLSLSTTPSSVGGVSTEVGALIRVSAEHSAQVDLAGNRDQVVARVRAAKAKELEVVAPVFLPRGCRVQVELTGAGTLSGRPFTAVVRKVQMIAVAPQYRLWVRPEEPLEGLGDLRVEAEPAPEPARPSDPTLGAALPRWASRMLSEEVVGEVQMEECLARSQSEGLSMQRALVEAGITLEETIASYVGLDLSVPYVDPREYAIVASNAEVVPEELARQHVVFPLFDVDGTITLGMRDPGDLALIDQIRLRVNRQVDSCLCQESALEELIDGAYRSGSSGSREPAPSASSRSPKAEVRPGNNPGVVELVDELLADAARRGVSDVHIEPERDKLRVRCRIDGILHETAVYPLDRHAPIVSRLKVLSKLDIAETRRPQDGHFRTELDRATLDVRVSTIPTVSGENAVLRLLLSDSKAVRLGGLGLPDSFHGRLEELLEHPNGMILVTGPTGSGKTTTLYAALDRLSTPERNVVTIEDPVEKRVPMLRQTEVNVKAGVTFASGLRSILRQDPDVIMVGEIRDPETAEISVQAALTGHLVLSTLHTNTAAGAIVRLSEIGIPPFLITSSLRAVLSQRLVRRICPACAEPTEPDARLLEGLGVDPEGTTFMKGAGCSNCLQTGYKGRAGIYEMLELTPALGTALLGSAARDVIEREAENALLGSMRADGLRRVAEGVTTLEEVARIVGLQRGES